MMQLREWFNTSDKAERDKALRRAFVPFTPDIEIAGDEWLALVVLLNLTLKRGQGDELTDKRHAKALLLDQKHLEKCVKQVRWLHSHNLKYPDSRVSHQRLVIASPPQIPGVVTSAGLPMRLGWANNSADINHAKLFCSSFLYHGVTTNLALQLATDVPAPAWTTAFRKLGLADSAIAALQSQLAQLLATSTVPAEVSPYSKQMRFWYQGDYCAITPVVSHGLMSQLHQLIYEKRIPHLIISHDHPASVGSLVGAVGGKIAVLHYPPPVSVEKRRNFSQSRATRINQGDRLFDRTILRDQIFIHALEHLIAPSGLTRRQRKQSHLSALRYLRRQLACWIAPLIEWRDEVEQNQGTLPSIDPSRVEWQVLSCPQSELPSFGIALAESCHLSLQSHPATRRLAFHPRLLMPIKTQLRWLLNKLALDESVPPQTATCCYLHLSGLRVYDAVALANPYLCGIPSLSALAGFCHDYERRLTAVLKRSVRLTGVAWYLRDCHLQPAKNLPEPSSPLSAHEVSAIRRPGLIDSKHCDLGMDLVLALHVDADHPAFSADEQNLLQAAFPSRFAGGCLHPPSLYEGQLWCNIYTNRGALFSKLSRLPRSGCWVYPHLSQVTDLEDLFETFSTDRRLLPISAGYVFLEPPQLRAGSVEKHHAYAESALGLALCINPVEMRLTGNNHFFKHGFWQLDVSNGAMLMTGVGNLEPPHRGTM
ncbi:type I-F CRISPR-associated protein Csy2 [Aeromonas enteropelogenes]|uniref:type I-F CRISPR-associated protein Csy2 n=1 Tax=Aeromonas enteropelogenes TaxID=29489 RepID=UPI003BA0FF11